MPRRYRSETNQTAPALAYEDPRTAYVNETNPDALYSNPHFISDLRTYYEERGLPSASYMRGEALVRQFLRDGVWRNVNTISALGSAVEAQAGSPESQARMARLEQASRNIPNFWQEGGRGWEAAGDIAGAALLDPVNLVGGLAAKGVASVATRGLTQAGLRGSTALGATAGIGAAAATEGAISAGQEAVVDASLQHRDISLGLQDEFDNERLQNAALMGGALGAGIGGLIGVPGAAIGAREGRAAGLARRNTQEVAETLLDPADPVVLIETVADDIATTTAQLTARQESLQSRIAEQAEDDLDTSDTQREAERTSLLQAAASALQEQANSVMSTPNPAAPEALAGFGQQLQELFDELRRLSATPGADDLDAVTDFVTRVETTTAPLYGPSIPTDAEIEAVLADQPQPQVRADQPQPQVTEAATSTDEATASTGEAPAETPTETPAPTGERETRPMREIASLLQARGRELSQYRAAGVESAFLDQAATELRSEFQELQDLIARGGDSDQDAVMADAMALLARLQGRATVEPALWRASDGRSSIAQSEAAAASSEAGTTPLQNLSNRDVSSLIPNIAASGAPSPITPPARAFAEANGIDPRLLTPSGRSGVITVADVRQVLQSGAAAPRSAPEFDLDAVDVAAIQRIWEADDDASRNARREFDHLMASIGDNNTLSQRELAQLVHAIGSYDAYKTDASTLAGFVRLADEADRALDPGAIDPALDAGSRAVGDTPAPASDGPATRTGPAGERSRARLTIDPDRASLYAVPGIDRVQAIFRRGRAISAGSDYTVTDGAPTSARDLSLETAKARAEADGSIQPYAHNGSTRVFGTGAKQVGKGDLVYYNPQTDKTYTSRAQAFKANGVDKVPAATPEVRTLELRGIMDMSGRQIDTLADNLDRINRGDRPLRKVKGVKAPPSPEIRAKQDAVPIPEGHVPVAAPRVADKRRNPYRVPSKGQIERGVQLSDILGAEDPDNWHVVSAPAEIVEDAMLRHGSDRRAIFEEIAEREALGDFSVRVEDVEPDVSVIDLSPKSPDRNRTVKPLSKAEADAFRFAAEVTGLNARHPRLYGQIAEGSEPKLRELAYLEAAFSNASWADLDVEDYGNLGSRMATASKTLAEMIGREAPDGIVNGNVAREVALKDFENIMSHLSVEEMNEALRFLSMSRGDSRGNLPRFDKTSKPDGTSAHIITPHGTQTVRLKSAEGSLPHLQQFYHEMAHWSYHNMLSPRDKAQFWKGMQKYFDGIAGDPNGATLHDALPAHNALLSRIKEDGRVELGNTNADASPAELFAEQFTLYMTREGHSSLLGQESYWRRFTRFIQEVMERFLGKSKGSPELDPELIPIFDRILPDSHLSRAETDIPESIRVLPPIRTVKKRSQGRIVSTLVEMDTIQDNIERAMLVGDPDAIVESFTELARFYAANRTYRLLKPHRSAIETRLRKLDEILGTERDDIATLTREQQQERFRRMERLTAEELLGERVAERGPVAEKLVNYYWFGAGDSLRSRTGATVQGVHGHLDYIRGSVLLPRYAEMAGGRPRVIRRAKPSKINGKKVDPNEIQMVNVEQLMVHRLRHRKRADILKAGLLENADSVANSKYREGPTKPKRLTYQVDDARKLNTDQLLEYFRENRHNAAGQEAAIEIVKRKQAALPEFPDGALNPDDRSLHRSEISRRVAAGIADGNPDVVARYGAEWQRRLKALKGPQALDQGGIIRPQFTDWQIEQEIADFAEVKADGIPPKARPVIRSLTAGMTHRNPNTQRTLRKLAYRLMSQMRKTERATPGNPRFLTDTEVARIADLDDTTFGSGSDVDFTKGNYSRLRNLLRGVARGMVEDSFSPQKTVSALTGLMIRADIVPGMDRSAMQKIFSGMNEDARASVLKAYGADYDGMDDVIRAERATTQLMSDQIAKWLAGDIRRDKLLAPIRALDEDAAAQFVTALDEIPERMAHLTNGLAAAKKFREAYPSLGAYGDMFRPKATDIEVKGASSPAAAHADVSTYLAKLSKKRRAAVSKFTKDSFGQTEDGTVRIMYVPASAELRASSSNSIPLTTSEGPMGKGVYINADPMAASAELESVVRAVNTKEALEAIGRKLSDEHMEIAQMGALTVRTAREMQRARRLELEDVRAQLSKDDVADRAKLENKAERLQRSMDNAILSEQNNLEVLGKLIEAGDIGVVPVVTNARNVIDLTPASRHNLEDESWGEIIEKATTALDGDIVAADAAFAQYRASGDEVPGDVLQNILLRSVTDAVKAETVDAVAVHSALTRAMSDLGFNGVYFNDAARGLDDWPTGTSAQQATLMLFKPKGVQRLTAKAVIEPEALLPRSEVPPEVRGAVMNTVAEGDAPSGAADLPATDIEEALESQSVDPAIGRVMTTMAKGRMPNEEEISTLSRLSKFMPDFLSEQSTRLRDRGFNWYADWFKDTFTRRQNAFGRKFMPLRSVIDNLTPDNSGFRRWKRGVSMGKLGAQPKEHARVLAALRYGPESRQFKVLTPKEVEAYTELRRAFDNELRELREAGVMVGRRLNYVPQVWNPEALRKNADEAKELFASYYQAERAAKGEAPAPEAEARSFAERVHARLSDEDQNGLLLDPDEPAVSRRTTGAKEDALDFSRVLELERYPEMLKRFEPYLEGDLETLLVKYFDGSSRRLENVRTLGVNNHAYYDYMAVAREGVEGIAGLLSTNRVFKNSVKGTHQGEQVNLNLPTDMGVPFAGNREAARDFAQQVVDAFGHGEKKNPERAREMLLNAHGRLHASAHYQRRVDAIIAGLTDLESIRTKAPSKEGAFEFAEKTLRLAMHQPLDDHQTNLRKVSSYARAFNSVSLLGFTTLSSLGDVVLPLVRSGNLKAFRDGVAKSLDQSSEGKAYRQFLYNSGVAIENVLHERMMNLYGTDAGKGQIAFFNATMLTPWTDTMRRMTAAVGFESFHAMQRIANENFQPGLRPNQQSMAYRRAHRYLHRYGLQDFLPGQPYNKVSLENWRQVDSDPVLGPKLGSAIVKFADETVFQPNPNDLPMWSQTPIGQMVFQLKSFQLMASRLTGYMVEEALDGNIRPLVYMLTAGGAFGAGVVGLKDIVQMRGGEEGRDAEFRRRNLLKSLGFDEEVHGDADTYLGWHAEGLGQIAGMGLLIDTIYGVVDQSENGAYGQTRIISMLGGPTAGAGMDAITALGGVTDSFYDNFREDPTNSKERMAARAVATRIPVVGGVRGAREGITDLVAGPRGGRDEDEARSLGRRDLSGGGLSRASLSRSGRDDE